jgi:hypothetical protein
MPWQRETIDSSMVTAHHRSSRTRRLGLLKSLVGGCLALVAICAHAWGAAAHRLIAEAAYGQLSPAARAAVDDLLTLEPGATFESISTWADEVRSPGTGPWHYVNLPRDSGCMYEATRDCPDERCVVGAIERQTAVLSSGAHGAERLKALKYLVHFVADIHQPLHVGYGDDRGGNLYQVVQWARHQPACDVGCRSHRSLAWWRGCAACVGDVKGRNDGRGRRRRRVGRRVVSHRQRSRLLPGRAHLGH